MHRDKKAVFVGCARDCGETIARVLANLSVMAGQFAESAFVFVENDSRDTTAAELRAWCRGRARASLISLDGLAAACPPRTVRLAYARNRYLSAVRAEYSAYDYLFVLDCDDTSVAPIDPADLERALDLLDSEPRCAGVFANSLGMYYDMWALRHPELCPGDVWEEVCDHALLRGVNDETAFRETFAKRIFALTPNSPPLKVDSAFGGLGIYKMSSILANREAYVGHKTKILPPGAIGEIAQSTQWQCCEHVAFNSGLRARGERLFILPFLINYRTQDVGFMPRFWRGLAFGAIQPVR